MSSGGPSFVEHNVEGVEGLHIAFNLVSERIERALFEQPHYGGCAANAGLLGALSLTNFSDECFQLFNAVRDTGLLAGLQTPDSGHVMEYQRAPGAEGLHAHFDDHGVFGETILGISLGAPSHLTMTPARGGQRVEVLLPRRSCYVLSGRARYPPGWMHGIRSVGAGQATPPAWNPAGVRRSITFRSSMAYALQELRHRAITAPAAQRAQLRQRIAALERHAGYVVQDKAAERLSSGTLALLQSARVAARLPARDAPFVGSLPPAVAALYRGRSAFAGELAPQTPGAGAGAGAGAPGFASSRASEEEEEVARAVQLSLDEERQRRRQMQRQRERARREDEEDAALRRALAESLAEAAEQRQQQRGERKRPAGGRAGSSVQPALQGQGIEVISLLSDDDE